MTLPAIKPLTAVTVVTMRLAFLAAVAIAPSAGAAEAKAAFKADATLGQTLSAACQACHVADGSRGVPANPILQGQHPDYIVKQLTEYKAGKRKNAIMNGFAATLSDADMRHIAAFYAGKSAKPGTASVPATVQLGQQIYRGGIAAKGVPACSGCHSPNGAGIPAQYPRLGGQHADYTESQLLTFRSGARANNTQMMAIAGKLSDAEIKAVSDYVTGLR